MSGWKQISGDMTWERHGVVLARSEPRYRQVHLVRIEPWLEHDREATVTHGLYIADEKTVDYEDLGVDRKEVQGALQSVGMEAAEYKRLAPEHKAEIIASYAGYDESRSVNRLADALPTRPEDIEFWGGKETSDKLESYDQELRREALEANFDTRFSFGELPSMEAIEFALGGEPFEMELQGQDSLAFEYATALVEGAGSTDTAEEFARTIEALAAAPWPADLDPEAMDAGLERVLAEWERRYGDPSDEEGGIAASAQSLASSMLSAIGFEWV